MPGEERLGEVLVEAMGVGDEVVISVSDTGRGMDTQQLAHLFEPCQVIQGACP